MSKFIDANPNRSTKLLGGDTFKASLAHKSAHGSILVSNPIKKANLTMAGSKSKTLNKRKVQFFDNNEKNIDAGSTGGFSHHAQSQVSDHFEGPKKQAAIKQRGPGSQEESNFSDTSDS